MEDLIIVKWHPEENRTSISLKEANYSVELIINMLVNSLCMMVQTCGENEHKLKDYELLSRIKKCIDNGDIINPNKELSIIIKINLEEEWVNISFPSEQGYLPIELTSDIISYSLFQIITYDKNPKELRAMIDEFLVSQFVRADMNTVLIDNEFLNK